MIRNEPMTHEEFQIFMADMNREQADRRFINRVTTFCAIAAAIVIIAVVIFTAMS